MTARYRHLLTKSARDPLSPRRSETLLGHLQNVDDAAQAVLTHSSQVLEDVDEWVKSGGAAQKLPKGGKQ